MAELPGLSELNELNELNELECRVCRSGAEEDKPLFYPCKCSGSIGAVHQDCLEAWLEHSKKDTCELCNTKYEFKPHYVDGMPSVLPVSVLTKSALKLVFQHVAPFLLRVVFAVLIWAVIVPVLTTCIYCVCVGRSSILSVSFANVPKQSWDTLRAHVVHGINIDAMIALSLLILVSFTDFLRNHLVPVPAGAEAPAAVEVVEGVPMPLNADNLPPAQNQAGDAAHAPAPAEVAQRHELDQEQRQLRHGYAYESGQNELEIGERMDDENIRNEDSAAPSMEHVQHGAVSSSRDNPPFRYDSLDSAEPRYSRHSAIHSDDYDDYIPLVLDEDSLGRWSTRAGIADVHANVENENDSNDNSTNTHSPSGSSGRRRQHHWEQLAGDDDVESEETGSVEEDFWREEFNRENENNVQNPPPEQMVGQNVPDNDPVFNMDPELDPQEGVVEVRLALFELLGVEGPFHLMFRNSFWLLGFCSMYLFFSVMLPFVMGKMLFQVLFAQKTFVSYIMPSALHKFVVLIQQHSGTNVPMQFLDFFYVSGGFLGIFSAVFLVDFFASALLRIKVPNYFKLVLELIGKLSTVIKVGSLLLVRIFLLPILLGLTMIGLAAPIVLPYTEDQWARFIAEHSLGAFALAWIAGITFMLTMTIFVLQLREVLHPDILAKFIRPQEPHVELINSLIKEPGHVHFRRVTISLVVYLGIMTVLVLVPLVQIALVSKMIVLEARKDVIGIGQHNLLLFLTKKLGVERMLLPFPTLPRSSARSGNGEDVQVGPALRRPPPGWDMRTPQQSSRWAWKDEEPSVVERNVAPRLIPTNWLLRVISLLSICWMTVNAIALYLMLVPIPLGRTMLSLLNFPNSLQHDPMNFVLGLVTTVSAGKFLYANTPSPQQFADVRRTFCNITVTTLIEIVNTVISVVLAAGLCGVMVKSLTESPMTLWEYFKAPILSEKNWDMYQAAIDAVKILVLSIPSGALAFYLTHAFLTGRYFMMWLAKTIRTDKPDTLTPDDIEFLDFLEYLTIVFSDLRNAWSEHKEPELRVLLCRMRKRLAYEFILKFVRNFLLSVFVCALTLFLNENIEKLCIAALARNILHLSSYLGILRFVVYVLYNPTMAIRRELYTKILNDNYLIGRTLVNNSAQAARNEVVQP